MREFTETTMGFSFLSSRSFFYYVFSPHRNFLEVPLCARASRLRRRGRIIRSRFPSWLTAEPTWWWWMGSLGDSAAPHQSKAFLSNWIALFALHWLMLYLCVGAVEGEISVCYHARIHRECLMKVINGESVFRKTAVSMLLLWKWKPSQSRLESGSVFAFLTPDLEFFWVFFFPSSFKGQASLKGEYFCFCKSLCVCRNLENDERKCHSLKAVITKQKTLESTLYHWMFVCLHHRRLVLHFSLLGIYTLGKKMAVED